MSSAHARLLCWADGPDTILPFPSRRCMQAYQGSTHPRPVSELKWGLGSQARTLEFVGSQQTLPSSEGLRTKRKRERRKERGKQKRGEKKERGTEGKGRGKGREKHRGVMSKGNSRQQMEALKWTTHSVRLRSGYPIFCARKKKLTAFLIQEMGLA